jgi:hypothetical protein
MLTVLFRLFAAVAGAILAIASFYFPIMKFIADVQPDFSEATNDPSAIFKPFLQWTRVNTPILLVASLAGIIGLLLLRYAARGSGSDSSDSHITYPGID